MDQYVDLARENDLFIHFAADTHQHNDYLKDITELQQRSPLELLAGTRVAGRQRLSAVRAGAALV